VTVSRSSHCALEACARAATKSVSAPLVLRVAAAAAPAAATLIASPPVKGGVWKGMMEAGGGVWEAEALDGHGIMTESGAVGSAFVERTGSTAARAIAA